MPPDDGVVSATQFSARYASAGPIQFVDMAFRADAVDARPSTHVWFWDDASPSDHHT